MHPLARQDYAHRNPTEDSALDECEIFMMHYIGKDDMDYIHKSKIINFYMQQNVNMELL